MRLLSFLRFTSCLTRNRPATHSVESTVTGLIATLGFLFHLGTLFGFFGSSFKYTADTSSNHTVPGP